MNLSDGFQLHLAKEKVFSENPDFLPFSLFSTGKERQKPKTESWIKTSNIFAAVTTFGC